ncbi:MerR family transcriptional regulator [Flavonifractor hominis]|uniref:MerR family transcriptional regulator n=1 Tax=Flavonifractor hominis TaxID=3133178 RepID=A0ABV1EU64_9FIRM
MKINEVEQLVGITKRNIRFYEKEGLLSPVRNADNGYRDYGEEDVQTLRKIKLLRKLDVPLEEIRKMQRGTLTLTDGVRRHIIQLEREQENLSTMRSLCQRLAEADVPLAALDAEAWLAEMERMEEEEGTQFVNIRKHDTITRYAGPVIAAAVFIALMAGLIVLMVWAALTAPAEAPPLGLMIFLVAVPGVIIIGVLLALWQRIKQIQGGEEDAASKY